MTVDALRDLARRHAPEPVKKVVRAARRAFRYLRGPVPAPYDVRPFLRTPDPAAMVATASNDFERLFYGHEGRQSFKTHHYFEIYDRHLTRFRGTPVRILEIGVQTGGSLQLWRKYFGRNATVFGIDIDERCRAMSDADAQVRIGSQADPAFLRSVVEEMGGLDVVVDDGGHVAEQQRISFDTLFPLLSERGIYICEDLCTSYWDVYHNGGYRRAGTFIEYVKEMIDDMHAWYHDEPQRAVPNAATSIHAICMYDSIVVIEKRPKGRPFFSGMPPSKSQP